jgi:hypothetical protein
MNANGVQTRLFQSAARARVTIAIFQTTMFSVGSALGWSVHLGVAASYLFLYTAYDKSTKSLSRELLRTVLTCGKSVPRFILEGIIGNEIFQDFWGKNASVHRNGWVFELSELFPRLRIPEPT